MASEPNNGQLAVTQHADGQIIVRLRLPKPAKRMSAGSAVRHDEAREAQDLSNAAKSEMAPRLRSGFGGLPRKTQFGKFAKHMVRNGCAVIEKKFGKKCHFMTITLPGSTEESMETLSRWTASIVDCLNHWVKSHVRNSEWVYVWELQKRGALHLHGAIGSSDAEGRRYLEENIKPYVHEMLSRLSDSTGVDLFGRKGGGTWRNNKDVLRADCKPVYKSVKRYMGKYLSKAVAAGRGFYPARWWGMSNLVRAGIDELRRCNARQSSLWGELIAAQAAIKQLLERLSIPYCAWSSWFSPDELSLSIYPDDDDSIPWYDLLSHMVWGVYVDSPHWAPRLISPRVHWKPAC